MTKRNLLTLFFVMLSSVMMAQNADQIYREGKALLDAHRFSEAIPKLKIAAEKGHKKAQYHLGRCYDKGEGVAEDNAKAFYWYLKAAAQGHAKAQFQVGKCYKKGKGVAQDPNKAFKYFMSSARQEYAPAQIAVAKFYVKQGDNNKAKQWLLKGIRNPKGGAEELQELKQEVLQGEPAATALMKLLK